MVTVSALSSDEEVEELEEEEEEEEAQTQSRISRSQKAGLTFPVGRIERKLRKLVKERIAGGAPVYMAGVLEYLIAEIVDLAGNCAASHGHRRIVPRDILLGVQGDEELARVWDGVIMPNTGRPISLHAALLPGSSRLRLSKAKRKKLEEEDVRKFKARCRRKQDHEEDSDDYPPTDDVDEDRYFPSKYRMTSPKPWPLRKGVPSRMRDSQPRAPKPRKSSFKASKGRDSPALPDEDMSPAPSSPPPTPPPPRPTKTPYATKTVPGDIWRRDSSVHKDKGSSKYKPSQRSPSLPGAEESENDGSSDNDLHTDDFHRKKLKEARNRPEPLSSSFVEVVKKRKKKQQPANDSSSDGNDSHTDDFHRKKLKEAKSKPAPPSSSFREVATKKKKKTKQSDKDSSSDGNDSHTDDFHRKKLKEAKSRPAPLSSSFREVTTKKHKKAKARLPSPPEDDDDEDDEQNGRFDASHQSYFPTSNSVYNWDDQPNTFFDNTPFFNDDSDSEVLPELPGIRQSSGAKTPQEKRETTSLPAEGSPSSTDRQFGSIRSPDEFPEADRDGSEGSQSVQQEHDRKRKKKKKKRSKQFHQSQDPPVPMSDKEASDGSDSDIGLRMNQDQPESQNDDFARDKIPADSLLQNRNRVLPPPLSTSYQYRRSASPGSTQKQKVELHNQRKRRSRSKSRLNRQSNFESSQESSQRSNRERSSSRRLREPSQRRETPRVSAPPEFPEFDLTQTTQGSHWRDSVYGASSQLSAEESQASQSQAKISSRPASPRIRALSQRAQGNIGQTSTVQAEGQVNEMELDELHDDEERDELEEDSPGTDGDDEHESDEETQPEGFTQKVSPELEETPPTRRMTSQTSAATSMAGSPAPGPSRRLATFRAQSTSTGLDPDSQVERALYTADEIAGSVLQEETYHHQPSSDVPTSRDSLFGSRASAPTSRTTSAPTSKDESQQELAPVAVPRSTIRAVSQPRSKRERVSTATVSATMVKDRQVIEISSAEEDAYDTGPGDGDEVIFVKEERLSPPVQARSTFYRPAPTGSK